MSVIKEISANEVDERVERIVRTKRATLLAASGVQGVQALISHSKASTPKPLVVDLKNAERYYQIAQIMHDCVKDALSLQTPHASFANNVEANHSLQDLYDATIGSRNPPTLILHSVKPELADFFARWRDALWCVRVPTILIVEEKVVASCVLNGDDYFLGGGAWIVKGKQ